MCALHKLGAVHRTPCPKNKHSIRARIRQTKMTPEQCKAARLLLGWDQKTLSSKAKIGRGMVSAFESGDETVKPGNVMLLKAVLNQHGVTFLSPTQKLRRIGVILNLPPEDREDTSEREVAPDQPIQDRPGDSGAPRGRPRSGSKGKHRAK